ncbi:hypothetical protein E0I26_02525 [Flavobacterium rhamnosiphilum]|uniref:Uncharacterized protein n=1 Tax=Flavobacterium rhamnosiphilum TaxID=2541724 RepID=A0A4R5FCY3_9FLAO|nr:hypothetical protein [Flavobacterium rhamnosiphilum]TDE46981.1 hypothetical protein E0I26_02525 [Flavobacterium rhamnosiphilum]
MKPNIETYLKHLKENFGENLTPQVQQVAADFVENHEEYSEMFLKNKISIISSASRLADATGNPEYSKHHKFNGLSIVLILTSIIFLFFSWKTTIILIVLSIIMKLISKSLKNKSNFNYTKLIYDELANDIDSGILKVCVNYCAGIVQLQSSKAKAHLPILPSACITGEIIYAKHS